ncbi:unnamed protein product [Pelagomonas calceolata]|uniref:Uncharacterized protein n=1 Tax=Pelagomonas calceolata TaxID=35677 RepID=A0A8J2SZI8_9STRA|nr:unnamed protein product [Pelagomonas calceolata]
MCCDYYYVHLIPLKQLAARDRRNQGDLVPVFEDGIGVDAHILLVDGQRQLERVLAQQLEPRRDGLPQRRRLAALGQLRLPLVDAGGGLGRREEDDLHFYGARHRYGCARCVTICTAPRAATSAQALVEIGLCARAGGVRH